ncbi:MAG: DNA-binding response regulator [Thermoleophilia bacterium]|nr:DNA-binding response regulator [Thermoleophilia bacterium]
MKVLVVVEDDRDMQLLIQLTLQVDSRLEITGCCATAAAAIQLAREVHPALVILDHFIDGDIMGLQAAPAIKAAAPDARVLLFTSHDLKIEAGREPSVDEFLLKRDISDLMPTVQRMLGLEPLAA